MKGRQRGEMREDGGEGKRMRGRRGGRGGQLSPQGTLLPPLPPPFDPRVPYQSGTFKRRRAWVDGWTKGGMEGYLE